MASNQQLMKKLIYFSSGTRFNIVFVIEQLSCHNSDPQVGYLHTAKQVFCFLKEIITLEIV